MFYKIKTRLSELTIEADQYRFSDGVAVFLVNHQLTNVLMDVESVEPACKFQVGDEVNCRGANGVVTHIHVSDNSLVFHCGQDWYFDINGVMKGFPNIELQQGHTEPYFKIHDRVKYGEYKGVVTGHVSSMYCVEVTSDAGDTITFTPDGRMSLSDEVTLSLVTPNWTRLEAEYYNALIKAGASASAADYAVTKTLTSELGLTSDFQRSLIGGFLWMKTTWGHEYWENISAVIQTPPLVKFQRLFSDKTPEIGDLVIAGDDDCLYYVGVYTQNGDASIYQYEVTTVDKSDSDWFKNIRCLNL